MNVTRIWIIRLLTHVKGNVLSMKFVTSWDLCCAQLTVCAYFMADCSLGTPVCSNKAKCVVLSNTQLIQWIITLACKKKLFFCGKNQNRWVLLISLC